MTLIIERLGFTGTYYIKDLPEFELIQRYYFANVGALTQPINEYPESVDLVIGIHSWNEMPLDQRVGIEAIDAKAYFIAYKAEYGGINNEKYFTEFAERRPHLTWHKWQPEYRKGGRWYLAGV